MEKKVIVGKGVIPFVKTVENKSPGIVFVVSHVITRVKTTQDGMVEEKTG